MLSNISQSKESLIEEESPERYVRAQPNGQPFDLYVEVLVVTDYTIYEDHQNFAQTTDQNLVFLYMRTYFAHYINGVNKHKI